jgi:hypothetical protein
VKISGRIELANGLGFAMDLDCRQSLLIYPIALAPFSQAEHDRRKRSGKRRRLILDARWDLGENGSDYEAVGFQFSELKRQHALCRAWDETGEFHEPLFPCQQVEEDKRFPDTSDDRQRQFYCAPAFGVESLRFHGLVSIRDTYMIDSIGYNCGFFQSLPQKITTSAITATKGTIL